MKKKDLHICLLSLLLLPAFAMAQEKQEGKLRVTDLHREVLDDSLRLFFSFITADSVIASTHKMIFTPLLRAGIHETKLAPVVVSGRRRWLYDRREEYVDPARRPDKTPFMVIPAETLKAGSRQWNYRASVPYAGWMNHAQLCLEERDKDCCNERLLGFQILDPDISLVYNCGETRADTVYVTLPPTMAETEVLDTLPPSQVELCVECTVVYVNFRQGKYDILPDFGNNRAELAKVDSVIASLPQGQEFRLYVSGYASPEGYLTDNEILARNRTEGFVKYLREHYHLPDGCAIRTSAVGEDWGGLVKLLQNTGKPYAQPALRIIRDYGVFDGRERKLMDMQLGDPYRDMLETLFPYLRRIEMRVRLDGGDE